MNQPQTNFKLTSSDLIYTPNIIRFVANEAKFDRPTALKIIVAGWPELTETAYENILEGNFTIEDDCVLVDG